MNKKSKLLMTVAASAIAVWVASSDVRAADAIVDIYDWSGFYIGADVGYGGADVQFTPHEGELDDGVADLDLNGFLGGVHAGVNMQQNDLVFGLEGDISLTDWSDDGVFSDNSSRRAEADVNFLASIRGRLGLAMDRTLVYATGGVAFADGDYTAISPGGTERSRSELSVGGVFGGGIEFAATDDLIVRAEGLYYIFDDTVDLGASSGEDDPPNQAELDDAFVVRVGISLKL